MLTEGILYQTPTYFQAVDFVALTKNPFDGDDGEYLSDIKTKLASTVNIPRKLTKNRK